MFPMKLVRLALGAVHTALLVFGAFSVCVSLLPSVLMVPIPSKSVLHLRHAYNSLVSYLFFQYATALVVVVCGTRLHVYCDDELLWKRSHGHGAVILCNHRTRVDWMYCGWSYAHCIHMCHSLKIILKNALKAVPFFGWGMQALQFVYLTRNRATDLPHIVKSMAYALNCSGALGGSSKNANQGAVAVLIFPEGTDLSESNIAKSNQYVTKKRLQETSAKGDAALEPDGGGDAAITGHRYQVLYPKTAGSVAVINEYLRYHRSSSSTCTNTGNSTASGSTASSAPSGASALAYIHDLTIAYEDCSRGQRTSDMGLLKGEFPKSVHLHVRMHALPLSHQPPSGSGSKKPEISSEDPAGDAAIEKLIQDSFAFKESLLARYYRHTEQTHGGRPPMASESTVHSGSNGGKGGDSRDRCGVGGEDPSLLWPEEVWNSDAHYWAMCRSLLMFLILSCIALNALCRLSLLLTHGATAWLVVLGACVMYAVLTCACGGLDMLELDRHYGTTVPIAGHSDAVN